MKCEDHTYIAMCLTVTYEAVIILAVVIAAISPKDFSTTPCNSPASMVGLAFVGSIIWRIASVRDRSTL